MENTLSNILFFFFFVFNILLFPVGETEMQKEERRSEVLPAHRESTAVSPGDMWEGLGKTFVYERSKQQGGRGDLVE